jgi:cation:H+ antiporter
MLSWAAEVSQLEISQALAVAILALIAVIPEYAVDIYLTWQAAHDPVHYAPLALANMTGANRMLVGLGWPFIVLLFVYRWRRPEVVLSESGHGTAIPFLLLATLYSFVIPLRIGRQLLEPHNPAVTMPVGWLMLIDVVVLVGVFAVYIWRVARADVSEPELVGPAALIGAWSPPVRRLATVALFAFSGVIISLSAEPFAEGLIGTGEHLGIPTFLLVQWLAPIASEAPEFIVAGAWTWRGFASDGLGALVSSKVNQWTLLVGTIPIVYSLGLGRPASFPLDLMQQHELFLTSAQSLFAVAVLMNLRLHWGGAAALLGLFLAQFFWPAVRLEVSAAYIGLSILLVLYYRGHVGPMLRLGLGPRGEEMSAQGQAPVAT